MRMMKGVLLGSVHRQGMFYVLTVLEIVATIKILNYHINQLFISVILHQTLKTIKKDTRNIMINEK